MRRSTEGTLNLLCDLLDRTIALSDERSRPYDLSFIWRPAIEDHGQNLNLGLKEILVVCVRDTAEHIGRNSLNPALTLVEFFEKRGASWQIFSRIALHLLRVLPTTTAGMVAERLLNRELFDSDYLKHEYYLLEGQCFGQLTDSQKEVILGWINAGPAYTDEQLKRWEENFGRAWTLEEKAENARLWKYDRLRPVEQSLSGSWKELYEQLSSMVRGPRHPEFTTYHEGGAYGPRAPKNQDDLLKLSVESLIAYLQDWAPSDTGFPSPSREGLGRALTSVVANSPHQYAAEASRFKELSEPTYIRAVVQGFHDALKQKVAFNWLPMLDLCIWIVRHEREAPERIDDQFREDPHWGWAQAAVVRLLVDGFATTENPISFAQRESVWIAIQAVTRDPQPTRQEEDEYWQPTANDQPPDEQVQKIDPLTNAINTPRGVAMDALVRYALWVRSNLEKLQDKQAVIAQGLSVMPEVRDVLDFHLNSENDPCVTIRAVYGLHLPWLQLLDPQWVEENTGRILPHNELPLWHAVWDTYVCSCQPFDNVFAWLHDEYAFAIEQVGTHNHNWANSKAADHSLAHHLMLLYSRGLLDAHRDLIAPFYRRADQKLRREALHFVGWTLRSGKEPLSEAVSQRLKLLLNTRISASKEPGSLRTEELEEYGWWFVSGKFDDAWSIAKLLEILQLVGWVVPDHLVVERLAQISQAEPLQCIECLTMLVNGDNRGWGVIGWRDEAMTIIRAARKSGDLESRKKAEELVNLLESRGNFEFGQLLNEPVP